MIERTIKRVKMNDAEAIFTLGSFYRSGAYGLTQDHTKALQLNHQAAELGYVNAYNSIGYAYSNGEGVEVDEKKARHYYELAAMGGSIPARFNLGINEEEAGNTERALKHYMIAVKRGSTESLNGIKVLYSSGHATKGDYTKALQSYQEYLSEIKSPQRDEAAETYEDCRYY